ncbi:MAG: type VI secretion system membrane subunit TssM [Proteobacteria bacterium]|nr:type VI secretion system membrane subunit TssM [Pseudomonadota bacterium]
MRQAIISRWSLSLVGVVILAALVWVFGPFLGALEGILPRAALIAGLLLVWAGVNAALSYRRRQREAALTTGIAEPDPSDVAVSEETAALRDKLVRSLALLRQARGTRGYLYEQPWYVIIGPPGAGKTTALLNSGLRFPLAAEMGDGPVGGVGGTRLCDWWFTDDAVLIDTAGRYTTQDSDAVVDRAGWQAFLDLLKRTRPRQPLNGVIVAIALTDIAHASAEERMAHAAAIRRRLKELRERLGVRLPVYALFTKADLIAGFTEFFDDLNREKRAQVWGTTFPLTHAPAGPVGQFGAAFQGLVERLDARLLDRMQAERSPDRRHLIAGFPAQIASLGAPLQAFLDAAFAGSQLDPAPMLRGVYLSSGTQEGTPIDRLTGVLAQSFGLDQRRAPSLRPEQGRSYFLGRLLRQVIMGEAMLVSEPPGTVRRRRAVQGLGYGAVTVGVLAALGLLWHSDRANSSGIGRMAGAVTAYRAAVTKQTLDPVTSGDLAGVAPLLDQARALQDQARGGGMGLSQVGLSEVGLSQSGKLASGARGVYRDALDRILLPRLIWRLENQMRANLDKPDFLYQATRVYLMLGNQGPLDSDLVRAWMRLDWERAYPGPANATLRDDLARDLDAMLAEPLPQVTLDGALIEAARATFSRVSLAERVYSRIETSAAATYVPAWTPAAALGAAGAQLFTRISGKPLTEGVPGFYTVAGFRTALLPALPVATQQVARESWVLGQAAAVPPTGAALDALQRQVVGLYLADYEKQWDAMIGDLALTPEHSLAQEAEALFVLGSPQSPMRMLLASMTRQLSLTQMKPPAAPSGNGAVTAVAAVLGQPQAEMAPLGAALDAHYQTLRDYVGHGPGAPLDLALNAINGLQQSLAQLASANPATPAAAPAVDPMLTLQAVASQAPQPVQRWLLSLTTSGAAFQAGGARAHAAAALDGAGGPAQLCAQAVAGRYPFAPGSDADVPLDDFSRLFAPGGAFDSFFNAQLRPYADTAPRVWRVEASPAGPAPITNADLSPFQHAAQIRDIYFPAGSTTPAVQLTFTPTTVDAGAKQVQLMLGATTITATRGVETPATVTWPSDGGSIARLVVTPASGPAVTLAEASGPWALFRLIGQGRLLRLSQDRFLLSFDGDGHRVVFAVRAASVHNPLAENPMRAFRCPAIR